MPLGEVVGLLWTFAIFALLVVAVWVLFWDVDDEDLDDDDDDDPDDSSGAVVDLGEWRRARSRGWHSGSYPARLRPVLH